MATSGDTVAARMREARFRTAAARQVAVSQAEMAAMVGKEAARSIHQTQWARYENGDSEPPLDVIRATARVSGLPESYIAFGNSPTAIIDPARDRTLTEEEENRAIAKSRAAKAATKRPGRGGKGGRGPA